MREGIGELREEIDQAAERVLGDQTDALRLAIQTLKDLERELQSEMEQFGEPSEEGQPSEQGQPGEGQPRDQEGDAEQQESSSDRQPGEGQDPSEQERQQQEGQQQEGQGQPGEGQPPEGEQQQQENQPPGQGQQNQEQQEPREGQQGQGQGQPREGEQQNQQDSQEQQQESESQSPGQQGGNQSEQQNENPQRARGQNQPQRGQERRGSNDGSPRAGNWDQPLAAPITGDDFREGSDRLRDVEEIVDDPELRAEAARIREEARNFRRDFIRNSEEPKWDLIKELVTNPIRSLRQDVSAELMRRAAEKNAIVPIDKDPVPQQFTEQVRRYYENLGSSE